MLGCELLLLCVSEDTDCKVYYLLHLFNKFKTIDVKIVPCTRTRLSRIRRSWFPDNASKRDSFESRLLPLSELRVIVVPFQ